MIERTRAMLAEIGKVYLQGDFRLTEGRIIRIMLCESESAMHGGTGSVWYEGVLPTNPGSRNGGAAATQIRNREP